MDPSDSPPHEVGQAQPPPSMSPLLRKMADIALTHPWWLGITGLLTVATVVIAMNPSPTTSTSSTQANSGTQNCVAQGLGNTVNCAPSTSPLKNSSLNTLRIDVNSGVEAVTTFVLPLDAPLETFPDIAGNGCKAEQFAWLKAHGKELRQQYSVTLRNASQSGGMLTLDHLRVKDLKATPATPSIWFACPPQGGGGVTDVSVDLDHQGMVVFNDGGGDKPGSLFAFNLEPGEEGHLNLLFQGAASSYSGRLVGDVSGPDGKRTVAIPINGSDTFNRLGVGTTSLVQVQWFGRGVFACFSGARYETFVECRPADIRSRLQSLIK